MRTLTAAIVLTISGRALAIDEAHKDKGEQAIAKAIAYLRSQQDAATGGWAPNNRLPAITGLVINGMAMQPGIGMDDPALSRAVAFILAKQQPDGGIYDQILPSYNTSICVSALARIDTPEAKAAVARAVPFLKKLQFGEGAAAVAADPAEVVGADHPFYGGVGYGKHGRPDLSNTGFWIQALHDAGVSAEDESIRRSLVFLSRVQMLDDVNDMAYADGSRQGGFVYATSENKDNVGGGQSQTAGMIEETMDDGTKVSRLRCYGSMTYAGFKSYIYAELPRDDVRVTAAYDWIRRNYTLEENPGIGTDGVYYYFVMFSRALDAWGGSEVQAIPAGAARVVEVRDWQNDLVDRLAGLQSEDGSFRVLDDRWMENDPVLITAYGLLALQHAVR